MVASLDHATTTPCPTCDIFKHLEDYAKRLEEVEKANSKMSNKISELEAKLAKYENPHTPSSAQRFKEKLKDPAPKERGAPKGHRGATRPIPEPTEYMPVTSDACEKCGSTDLEEVGTDPAVREDLIRQQQQIKVIQYDRGMYRCNDCGHEFTAKHEDCPQKGRFGINILVYITMLKFSLRGVLRKIGEFAGHTNSFSISPMGVHDILLRVGEACKTEYSRNLESVQTAEWRYIDETGMKVKGKNWWLWIFRTVGDDVLVVIRPSRGGAVLREILGTEISGAGVSDGWRAYNALDVLQRCWAHLLREVDDFVEKPGGEKLSKTIHRMFKDLKLFLGKDPPMVERRRQKRVWDQEMDELVERFSGFKELEKPLTYIRNGLGSWYTCLLYPGMEPTNNLGEQAMREHVLMRKIIGTFRSEKGVESYQYIASMFATWRLQGKDIYKELEELLKKELCLK